MPWNVYRSLAVLRGLSLVGIASCLENKPSQCSQNIFNNWSLYHSCSPKKVLLPRNNDEVCDILRISQQENSKVTCIGSSLSPNGCGLSNDVVVSLELMHNVIDVDENNFTITVQAGATIAEILDELDSYELTLPNLASINLQQVGGLTQVGAHGTGATIPPLDDAVLELDIVTPSNGLLTLSESSNETLFKFAKCGLGVFGIVTAVKLQCVPKHKLREEVKVMSRNEVRRDHRQRLVQNDHVKYLWIPHTDSVVVVTSSKSTSETTDLQENKMALHDLIQVLRTRDIPYTPSNFADARSAALCGQEHDLDFVRKVNFAELEYWKRSQGTRVDWSENILSFDCGGRQLVWEVTHECHELSDINFITSLLKAIESAGVPAPAPIEQRWSKASSSLLSPAYSVNKDTVFSWVGIIFYLPGNNNYGISDQHQKIFSDYIALVHDTASHLGLNVRVHWAKLDKYLIHANLMNKITHEIRNRPHLQEIDYWRRFCDENRIMGSFWSEVLG